MKTKKTILAIAIILISVGVFAQVDTSGRRTNRMHNTPNSTYTTTPHTTTPHKQTPKTGTQKTNPAKTRSMNGRSYKSKKDSVK